MSEPKCEFETFEWNGQTRYKCNRVWESGTPCEYDTYDLAALEDHIRFPHNRSGKIDKVRKVVSTVVDSKGNTVVFDEKLAPEFESYHFKE